MFDTTNFDNLALFILNKYNLSSSFRFIVLNEREWESFDIEKTNYKKYFEKYIEPNLRELDEKINEWDNPRSDDLISATCESAKTMLKCIDEIKNELNDQELLKTFNSETKFIQKLFKTYDYEYLILINDVDFSTLLLKERPCTIAHEVYHIVELNSPGGFDKGEVVDDMAKELVKEYFISLNREEAINEVKKLRSRKVGNEKYK